MKPNDFRSLGLNDALLRVLKEMGFAEMTPVQAATLPVLLAGKDLIGQSKTGSGKTAAFVIPLLQKITIADVQPQALILCPTRELCDQVLRECQKFSKYFPKLHIVSLVGGQPYPPQENALLKGVHLIVGTPGRTLEHLKNGMVNVSKLKTLVLDEADRLLEEGFAEEMQAIIQELPAQRQTVFFSATFPESMAELSQRHQNKAERITIQDLAQNSVMIEQHLYAAEKSQKLETLVQILLRHPSMCTLIFCRTKALVAEIGKMLAQAKVSSQVLHADLPQAERDRTTALFRNGSLRILVATDVAARGLDIDTLELVINVDLPASSDIYIHRIGRTGRAGRTGTAVSIATDYEVDIVAGIETATGVKMHRQTIESANTSGLGSDFQKTLMKSIQISAGRAEKLKPEEILAALTSGAQPLLKSEIGKIEIQDRLSYVAITPSKAESALNKLRNTKFKTPKIKMTLILG